MSKIYRFEEFVNEGFSDAVKFKYRITKVNSFAFEKLGELIQKNQKINLNETMLSHIKNDVEKFYNETMNGLNDVMKFNEWWKEFIPKAMSIMNEIK